MGNGKVEGITAPAAEKIPPERKFLCPQGERSCRGIFQNLPGVVALMEQLRIPRAIQHLAALRGNHRLCHWIVGNLRHIYIADGSGIPALSSIFFLLALFNAKHTLIGKVFAVVVEDIIDTGCTMQKLLENLGTRAPESIHVCTLLLKPEKLKVSLDVEYVALEIPNEFIVGYGLDYDGYGRNLRDIYTVVE